jgi:beta-glucosidase
MTNTVCVAAVPGEDPFHSGEYGTAVVNGVQWDGGSPALEQGSGGPKKKVYTKINAALKHFFAYSVESGRGSTDFNISQHDIYDTYLPSFEAPIVQANAKGYMCAYTSINGQPSCGSKFLSGTARNQWNFSGYVVSDCGGVGDISGYEHTNASETAAIGLRDGGVDINCGGGLTNHICAAIKEGLVEEAVLDASLERSMTLLLDAGMFDPLEQQPFTRIPFQAIGSEEHRAIAEEAAEQAQVR